MEKTTLPDDFLPFALPVIEEEEIREVLDVLKSAWITTGPKVKLFETEFARYIGCKHAITFSRLRFSLVNYL